MRKTSIITLTMTFGMLTVVPGRTAAQAPQVPPPGASRSAAGSTRQDQKERHHTDAEFAQLALAGGKKEVASATFAGLTASSPDVKALANRLIKDHTAANDELDRMLRAREQPYKEERPSTKSEPWRTETGASFDRAYVKHVIDVHEDAIELFEDQSAKGTDAELKAWAEATLPTLREHFKMARDLKSKLGS